MKQLATIALVLAACGGSSAPKAPNNASGSGSAGGPPYAALFTQGASWTFALTNTTTPPPDIGEPTSGPAGTMTCKVAMAHAMGATQMSKVECESDGDSPGDGFAPSGYWIANAAGLWHFMGDAAMDEVHAKAENPDPKRMLIAASPTAHQDEVPMEDDGGTEFYFAKARDGGGWCTGYTMALGDEGGWSICFDGAGALVSGSWFSAGATINETTYQAK